MSNLNSPNPGPLYVFISLACFAGLVFWYYLFYRMLFRNQFERPLRRRKLKTGQRGIIPAEELEEISKFAIPTDKKGKESPDLQHSTESTFVDIDGDTFELPVFSDEIDSEQPRSDCYCSPLHLHSRLLNLHHASQEALNRYFQLELRLIALDQNSRAFSGDRQPTVLGAQPVRHVWSEGSPVHKRTVEHQYEPMYVQVPQVPTCSSWPPIPSGVAANSCMPNVHVPPAPAARGGHIYQQSTYPAQTPRHPSLRKQDVSAWASWGKGQSTPYKPEQVVPESSRMGAEREAHAKKHQSQCYPILPRKNRTAHVGPKEVRKFNIDKFGLAILDDMDDEDMDKIADIYSRWAAIKDLEREKDEHLGGFGNEDDFFGISDDSDSWLDPYDDQFEMEDHFRPNSPLGLRGRIGEMFRRVGGNGRRDQRKGPVREHRLGKDHAANQRKIPRDSRGGQLMDEPKWQRKLSQRERRFEHGPAIFKRDPRAHHPQRPFRGNEAIDNPSASIDGIRNSCRRPFGDHFPEHRGWGNTNMVYPPGGASQASARRRPSRTAHLSRENRRHDGHHHVSGSRNNIQARFPYGRHPEAGGNRFPLPRQATYLDGRPLGPRRYSIGTGRRHLHPTFGSEHPSRIPLPSRGTGIRQPGHMNAHNPWSEDTWHNRPFHQAGNGSRPPRPQRPIPVPPPNPPHTASAFDRATDRRDHVDSIWATAVADFDRRVSSTRRPNHDRGRTEWDEEEWDEDSLPDLFSDLFSDNGYGDDDEDDSDAHGGDHKLREIADLANGDVEAGYFEERQRQDDEDSEFDSLFDEDSLDGDNDDLYDEPTRFRSRNTVRFRSSDGRPWTSSDFNAFRPRRARQRGQQSEGQRTGPQLGPRAERRQDVRPAEGTQHAPRQFDLPIRGGRPIPSASAYEPGNVGLFPGQTRGNQRSELHQNTGITDVPPRRPQRPNPHSSPAKTAPTHGQTAPHSAQAEDQAYYRSAPLAFPQTADHIHRTPGFNDRLKNVVHVIEKARIRLRESEERKKKASVEDIAEKNKPQHQHQQQQHQHAFPDSQTRHSDENISEQVLVNPPNTPRLSAPENISQPVPLPVPDGNGNLCSPAAMARPSVTPSVRSPASRYLDGYFRQPNPMPCFGNPPKKDIGE